MVKQKPEILLIGDLVRHVVLKPEGYEGRFVGYVREATDPLLPGIIEEALLDIPSAEPNELAPRPSERWCSFRPAFSFATDEEVPALTGFGELHSVLDSFCAASGDQ